MEDIYAQMDEAFDKLWEECGCPHSKDKTTNVKGNLARRALNDASNEKKIKMARKTIEPSKGE
jgi:hypothetical protein